MIELFFEHERRVLLVRYATELTHPNLEQLDRQLVAFVAREGRVNTIIDFSEVTGDVPTADIRFRGESPARMPDRRRIFVAPTDLVFGMLRIYGAHQDIGGTPPPTVVRTIAEAYALLDLSEPTFEPWE